MAGALPHLKQGPATYTAAGLVLGGQLVRPAVSGDSPPAGLTGIGVVPCGASGTDSHSNTVLGVAATDSNTGQFSNYDTYGPESGASIATASWAGDNSQAGQDQLLDQSILGYSVAVYNNVDINVNYTSNANFGQLLVAGANGSVMAWSSQTFDQIVGRCTQPGGVVSGNVGRAFIRV